MPLIKSSTPKAFKANIRKEVSAGMPVRQAVAVAFKVKRSSPAKRAHQHVQRKYHRSTGY